ncbi:MAG TPA: SpoIIE family protein phosphatase [Candidatus Acidoferrales bacterium]|nr:SpoIIE family protein phosphatase [Candidatus Acidoferrales bacterium]
MEILEHPLVEYGVANFALPGEGTSGDIHVLRSRPGGLLVAAIDGIGHGEEAAGAAKTAASILTNNADEPIISLVEECHRSLRSTRGVVLSVASIDLDHGMMTWLGVGNVVGALARVVPRGSNYPEMLLLRGGIVGKQLPPLQAAVLPVFEGDTLIFTTDGIDGRYVETVSARENPQFAAGRIMQKFHTATDDALVLVVRLTGVQK